MKTTKPLDTNSKIEKFAKDFGIEYVSYKYDEKNLVVKYKCVDASPSEVSYYSWSVPAFIVSTYLSLIQQTNVEARIDEAEKSKQIATNNFDKTGFEIAQIFSDRIAQLKKDTIE
jgi:hypothetical protein